MFELRRDEDDDGRELTVNLLPRKYNATRPDPVGLRFSFGTEAILVRRVEATEVQTPAQTTRLAILAALEQGPQELAELAKVLEMEKEAIKPVLTRLKARGVVENPARGVWRLA